MAACEKCWGDAFSISYGTSQTQSEAYQELLEERKENPCTPEEQAGQWWDNVNKIDKRNMKDIRLYHIKHKSGIILQKYGVYKKHHKFTSVKQCEDFIESKRQITKRTKQFVIVEYTGNYDAEIVKIVKI